MLFLQENQDHTLGALPAGTSNRQGPGKSQSLTSQGGARTQTEQRRSSNAKKLTAIGSESSHETSGTECTGAWGGTTALNLIYPAPPIGTRSAGSSRTKYWATSGQGGPHPAWRDSGADVLFGIGGTPEGVISAAALKCMGGAIQGRLWPRNEAERTAALEAGYDLDQVLATDDLVAGDNCFFSATGITDGDLVKGVHYTSGKAHTQSLVMRSKSRTVRMIEAHHVLDKLEEFSPVY